MSDIEGDTPALAEYYDQISDTQFELGLLLTAMMGLKAGDTVLDVGCGTGRLAFHVSDIVGPAGTVIGIDPSPHRILVADGKRIACSNNRIQFAQGEGEALVGFADSTFDILYYCAVFHWIGDKRAALNEAYRVLRPGGKVGITSRNRSHPSIRRAILQEALDDYPEAMQGYKNNVSSRWADRDELETLLTNAGFTNISFETRLRTLYFKSPEDYFAFIKASSFGQSSGLPEGVRLAIAKKIAAELEKRRTPQGIEFQTSSLFAIAGKPV